MDVNDTSYMEFLKIYFPATADTVAALKSMSPKGETPEELKKSTAEIEEKVRAAVNKSDCVGDYNAYLSIPEGIRTRYTGTKVPDDVMEAARRSEVLTLLEMEQHPEIKRVEDARAAVREKYGIPSSVDIPADIITSATAMAVFAAALKEGYSQGASLQLAHQRQHREGLLEEKAAILTNPNLSEAEKKEKLKDWLDNKWLKSKEDTVKTIKEDRAKYQPEKHLIYLLNKFNRGKLTPKEKETFNDDIAELASRILTEGRQDKLLQYLKDHPSIVKHYKEPTLEKLSALVLNKIPEAEREQYLSRDFFKKRGLKEEMSDDKKAAAVAKDLKQAQANALPRQSTLSTEDKRSNMPTTLRREGYQREA